MASHPPSSSAPPLDRLLLGAPGYWLAVLVTAAPWLRVAVGAWTLYPGHVALGALLAAALLSGPGWREALRPLAPLMLLGGYVATVSALRGEWHAAAAVAGVTLMHFVWGAAAMRVGMAPERSGALREALAGLLALSLGVGLLGWAAQALWPAACRVLGCSEGALAPYAFTGGWLSADQFLLFLIFLLAPLGGLGLAMARSHAPGGKAWQIPVLLGLAGLAVLAGAAWWTLALAAAGWGFTWHLLGGRRAAPERQRLQTAGLAVLFGFVLIFGLEPGYFQRLWAGHASPPPVRIELPGAPPRGLTSEAPTPVALVLTNTGWRTLPGTPDAPLKLQLRLLVTPERGITRTFPGPTVTVPDALPPGESRTVRVLVRIPPWVRDGYLAWELRAGDGRRVPADPVSPPGFRFINAGHRRLVLDPENLLTAQAARARTYAQETAVPTHPQADGQAHGNVLGGMLDTVFFSPFWGQPAPDGMPFAAERPFLPALIHHYGLIGLALAAWCAWRFLRRAVACGEPGHPAWLLAPVAVLLLVAAGWFTSALASYHAHWAFFLLAGFLEGRYALKYPWPRMRLAPRRPAGVRRRLRWPLPRIPGLSSSPRPAGGR